MRTKAFWMAVAGLAVSGGIAEAQVRPLQPARPGQYGGGLVEYLFSGRAAPTRPVAMRAVQPAAYGYGASASQAGYGDPMARYQLEPGAGSRRMASVQQSYANPYEDVEPAMGAPDASWRAPSAGYRNAPPIAHAPDPQFARQVVPFEGHQRPGTVVIDTQTRHLYLVQPGKTAIRYGIGVGRPGFLWHGVKSVSAKKEWPDWTPPKEMLARRPDLPTFMAGGVENPLGARALYLGSSLYRIHGTNEPNTIGQAVSSGCIRMMNEDVIDLYDRTPVGSRVEVI